MITSTIENLPKATAQITITIIWDEVKESYQKIFNRVVNDSEIAGFRKGKAPKKLIEDKIDKTKIYEEVVKEIIPNAYGKAVQEQKIRPVSSPKIEVIKAKENENWVIKATVALKPTVKLKNYKEKIKELKQSKTKIWTPGSDPKKEEEKKPTVDEIVRVLLAEAEVELSEILVTDEANRLLTGLIDQTQKLGMTVEQYLLAKGKTTEQLRAEYALQASNNLKIEFIINEIAETEKITVTQEDLDKLISKAEKPEERENLKKESYYLAHLIRQQKTFDFLNSL
jgi:trigger factor